MGATVSTFKFLFLKAFTFETRFTIYLEIRFLAQLEVRYEIEISFFFLNIEYVEEQQGI